MANRIFHQCPLRISSGRATRIQEAHARQWLGQVEFGNVRVLQIGDSSRGPSSEERAMVQGVRSEYGASPDLCVQAYYVPRIYHPIKIVFGASYHESVSGYGSLAPGVVLDNDGGSDVLAHELGHVLIPQLHHTGNRSNLMAAGPRRTGHDLTDDQCRGMRDNA